MMSGAPSAFMSSTAMVVADSGDTSRQARPNRPASLMQK
jgi:hypothetical protein